MQPGDRLVCAFVEPKELGTQFKQWFLHITIVPWFRVDANSQELAVELSRAYVGSHGFEVLVGEEAQFGYKNRKTVNLVSAPELPRLEGQTRRLLHSYKAWVVDEADNTRRRHYKPHVTHNRGKMLKSGDTFRCNQLYIVEQKGDYKEVVGIVELDHEAAA
jgi:2'-5' RNA ligase